MSEEATWHDRKQKTREAYYSRITKVETEAETPTMPETTGAASLLDASDWDRFARMDAQSGSPSFGTSATATVPSGTLSASPASSMPAENTRLSSDANMVWMVSPVIFSEQSLKSNIVDPHGSLVPGLPPRLHASLQALATARAERVEDTVLLIAEFFVENEDERAEGPLWEALSFYMENYG